MQPFPSHTFVDLNAAPFPASPTPLFTAKREVFEKTLALFCSIKVDGCHANVSGGTAGQATDSHTSATPDEDDEAPPSDQPVNSSQIESTLIELLAGGGQSPASGTTSAAADTESDMEYDDEIDAEGEIEVDERLLYRPSHCHRIITCPGTISLRVGKKTGKSYLR